MKDNIRRLYAISKKKKRKIIGLMSGTSLDGLDIALCNISGSGTSTSVALERFETISYDEEFRNEVYSVFSKEIVSLEKLCLLNEWIAVQQAGMVNSFLEKWGIDKNKIDLIASHGQTIYHAPLHQHKHQKFGNSTLQIGDGDHIAVNTGIITISDFRQKHIAKGGEGAPLAVYGDIILFSNKKANTVLLNIGGITNFTFLPAKESTQKLFSTDIGPGNTLMDAWMQKKFSARYDKDAITAKKGNVNPLLLSRLLADPFFSIPFPKTTGPELFNLSMLETAIRETAEEINDNDVMATLNAFTATVIVKCIKEINQEYLPMEVLVSGGGWHNPLLMDTIRKNIFGVSIFSTSDKNIDPDAKEAILFAILGNECVGANGKDYAKELPALSMGKISFPD